MHKLTLALAGTAVLISVVALVRSNEDSRKTNEIVHLFEQIINDLEFAKIIKHIGDTN